MEEVSEDKTFEQLAELEVGTLVHDEFEEGVRFIIMRGPSALCAYVGIPEDHPLAGIYYDDLPLSCHGGLTFSGKGEKKYRPEGFYWYGWDYSHCYDFPFYSLKPEYQNLRSSEEKKWVVKDVVSDSFSAIYDFKKLVKLAEKIKNKPN